MIVEKIIQTTEDVELDVTDATLLSIEEAEQLLTEEERMYDGWWWLRSPGEDQSDAAFVRSGGSVRCYGYYVYDVDVCVRPALKIENLKTSYLTIGDKFTFGDKAFKVISDSLAFCLNDIGQHCFNEDWTAEDANDYEKSDVKKYVDKWFNNVINKDKGN